jgi:hypothetical protein
MRHLENCEAIPLFDPDNRDIGYLIGPEANDSQLLDVLAPLFARGADRPWTVLSSTQSRPCRYLALGHMGRPQRYTSMVTVSAHVPARPLAILKAQNKDFVVLTPEMFLQYALQTFNDG